MNVHALRALLAVCCWAAVAQAGPAGWRVSRDMDKRAAMLGRERGSDVSVDDVSAESDVSELQRDAGMTSESQNRLRALSAALDTQQQNDLEVLTRYILQVLKRQHSDSTGAYLGEKHNSVLVNRKASLRREQTEERKDDKEEDTPRRNNSSHEQRLREIYDSLKDFLKDKESLSEKEEPKVKPLNSKESAMEKGFSGVHTEEGSFGGFVDDPQVFPDDVEKPSSHRVHNAVMTAIEKTLLEDIRAANAAGISVEDILVDLGRKAHLRFK